LDPRKDFTHIAYIGGIPAVLIANFGVPVSDIKTLVEYSHATPAGLSLGSPGLGTRSHIAGVLFRELTQANMTHIPYKGGAQAISDVLGNHIPAAFVTLNSARSLIDEGRVKALAITSASRLAHYGSVPTFAELGFPKLVGSTWFGISGPAGMPVSLTDKINRDINRALAATTVKQFLAEADFETAAMSPSEFTDFLLSEVVLLEPFLNATSKP
jgi:tripartite-type tricarboxylate transporter receptor subunit TctC